MSRYLFRTCCAQLTTLCQAATQYTHDRTWHRSGSSPGVRNKPTATEHLHLFVAIPMPCRSHNVPPYGRAGLYKQLATLKDLIGEDREARNTAAQQRQQQQASGQEGGSPAMAAAASMAGAPATASAGEVNWSVENLASRMHYSSTMVFRHAHTLVLPVEAGSSRQHVSAA
jgi:hypothetical protein